MKVWHALYDHALSAGAGQKLRETDIGTDHPEPYLYCIWAVDLLARLLAAAETRWGLPLVNSVDLGWIRKSAFRNKGGHIQRFRVRHPPAAQGAYQGCTSSLCREGGQEIPGGQRGGGTLAEDVAGLPIRPTIRMNLCPTRSELRERSGTLWPHIAESTSCPKPICSLAQAARQLAPGPRGATATGKAAAFTRSRYGDGPNGGSTVPDGQKVCLEVIRIGGTNCTSLKRSSGSSTGSKARSPRRPPASLGH